MQLPSLKMLFSNIHTEYFLNNTETLTLNYFSSLENILNILDLLISPQLLSVTTTIAYVQTEQ